MTITGDSFVPKGVRVMVGGRHAEHVQVVDEKTIVAVTHWHRPGVVDVEVSNPDDQKGPLVGGFTYDTPEQNSP